MEGFNLSGRNKGLVSVSTTVQDESTEEGKEPSWKDMSIIKFWAQAGQGKMPVLNLKLFR